MRDGAGPLPGDTSRDPEGRAPLRARAIVRYGSRRGQHPSMTHSTSADRTRARA